MGDPEAFPAVYEKFLEDVVVKPCLIRMPDPDTVPETGPFEERPRRIDKELIRHQDRSGEGVRLVFEKIVRGNKRPASEDHAPRTALVPVLIEKGVHKEVRGLMKRRKSQKIFVFHYRSVENDGSCLCFYESGAEPPLRD